MSEKQLLRIAANFTSGLLGKGSSTSMCYAVCAPLHSYLSAVGYATELIEGEIEADNAVWGHFWLQLPNGKILDPTADQFNKYFEKEMPRIYLGERPPHYKIMN